MPITFLLSNLQRYRNIVVVVIVFVVGIVATLKRDCTLVGLCSCESYPRCTEAQGQLLDPCGWAAVLPIYNSRIGRSFHDNNTSSISILIRTLLIGVDPQGGTLGGGNASKEHIGDLQQRF